MPPPAGDRTAAGSAQPPPSMAPPPAAEVELQVSDACRRAPRSSRRRVARPVARRHYARRARQSRSRSRFATRGFKDVTRTRRARSRSDARDHAAAEARQGGGSRHTAAAQARAAGGASGRSRSAATSRDRPAEPVRVATSYLRPVHRRILSRCQRRAGRRAASHGYDLLDATPSNTCYAENAASLWRR